MITERRFKSSSLRTGKDQGAPTPLHLTTPEQYTPVPPIVSEAFKAAMLRPCPTCAAIAADVWHSSEAVAEKVVHFNDFQTALINTACRAMADLTGNETFLHNPASTIAEMARLFMATDPVAALGVRFDRPSRIERGKWGEMKAEHQRGMAVTVTDAPPSADQNPEVIAGELVESTDGSEGDGSAALYDEAATGEDLYRESEGKLYDDDQSDSDDEDA